MARITPASQGPSPTTCDWETQPMLPAGIGGVVVLATGDAGSALLATTLAFPTSQSSKAPQPTTRSSDSGSAA